MKTFSVQAAAAIASGDVLTSGAVWFGGSTAVGFWGGFGNIVIDGRPYVGIGDRGLVQASGGTLGGAEQGAELTLSGVDADVAAALEVENLRGVPGVIYRLIFNGAGSVLLHAAVYLRGRVDRAPVEETPGGMAKITISVEGAARGLGRRSERMRSHNDQQLIKPGDGGLSRIAYAGDKDIYWGGQPPQRAGGAMGGSYFTGSGGVGSGGLDRNVYAASV